MVKVFVNGTFDIIHEGHLGLLNFAKSLGDHLTVGIDDDNRVKQLKGNLRPIFSQKERKILLENLKAVDNVIIFSSNEELINLVKTYDIVVKGSDYRNKMFIEKPHVKELIFYERIEGYSTTEKIKYIASR